MVLHDELTKYFGFSDFRPHQKEIIDAILEQKSVLAVLPTGGGKSLCYQLPALVSEGFAVVISPLISLMKDQTDSLNKTTTLAAFINSSLSYLQAEEILRQTAAGTIKLLYLAPEKLESREFSGRIKNLKPKYLFVDEAHCISQWGHNFRPSYSKIKEFAEFIGIRNISAFTATATPEVVDDIIAQLGMKDTVRFIRGFERGNLQIQAIRTSRKKDYLIDLLNRLKTPAIVYTSSRKTAGEVNEHIACFGISTAVYHAGLSSEVRRQVQDMFIADKIKVVCATNAFGMGIDKKDVRLVIHYNMPGSIENYYQEIGRAGRDGLPADAVILFNGSDRGIHEYFISTSYPPEPVIRGIYNAICDYGKVALGSYSEAEIPVDMKFICNYLNQKLSAASVDAAVAALERSGYVRSVSEFEKKFYLQFNMDSRRILKYAETIENTAIKSVITLLLRHYGGAVSERKTRINLEKAAQSFGISPEHLRDTLTWLHNTGIADFTQPVESKCVRLTSTRVHERYLLVDNSLIEKMKERAYSKLSKMESLLEAENCRMKAIIEYFGENEPDYRCGKCDNCLKLRVHKPVKHQKVETSGPLQNDYESGLMLYNRLKEIRNEAAAKFQQAPFLVCSDEIIRRIAELKPVSHTDLLNVPGFNQRMFNKVGYDFLEAIKDHIKQNQKQDESWAFDNQ